MDRVSVCIVGDPGSLVSRNPWLRNWPTGLSLVLSLALSLVLSLRYRFRLLAG